MNAEQRAFCLGVLYAVYEACGLGAKERYRRWMRYFPDGDLVTRRLLDETNPVMIPLVLSGGPRVNALAPHSSAPTRGAKKA